ncbi:YrdB family protein [Kitasatospora sp. NPDC018058]|uniref:YrdB family protein n=1 Tax=Kitasatospora sp. NPDC018058 TaxID=3364025 RepID=UPI0037C1213D
MTAGTVLAAASATLAFLLEMSVYVSAGYWGFTRTARLPLRLALATGAVALLIVVWGQFGSPTATHPLHGPARAVLELVWFGAGDLALLAAGGRRAALWFTAAWALSTALQAAMA